MAADSAAAHASGDVPARWDRNAASRDERTGAAGNDLHLELMRPALGRLLGDVAGTRVRDLACGNGVFARRLAERGARVVATDVSAAMLDRARAHGGDGIEYRELDATDAAGLAALGRAAFDAVVCNEHDEPVERRGVVVTRYATAAAGRASRSPASRRSSTHSTGGSTPSCGRSSTAASSSTGWRSRRSRRAATTGGCAGAPCPGSRRCSSSACGRPASAAGSYGDRSRCVPTIRVVIAAHPGGRPRSARRGFVGVPRPPRRLVAVDVRLVLGGRAL